MRWHRHTLPDPETVLFCLATALALQARRYAQLSRCVARGVSEEAVTHLRTDPDLAPLVEEHGSLELEPADDPFRRLVVSLTRQQVSMAAADAIEKRLFDAVEVTPGGLLAAEESTLRDAGLSTQKTEYVRAVARTWRKRGYDRGFFEGMDNEAVTAELTDIHGVGTWTAKMFLLLT